MENSTSSNTGTGLKVALGIALVLFLGTGFYTMNLYKESKQTQKELTEEKQLVMDNLNAMSEQYDKAIKENDIANADLVAAKARIEGLKDSLRISGNNVRSLWRYKSKYLSLQKEMNILLAQNDSLRVENSYLATSLDSTQIRLDENTMFADSLLVQNTALADVVENAAVLSTAGLKALGVIERTSGSLIPTERASRADKIKICFTVAKNSLVSSGDQELFVQVLDPKQNVIGPDGQLVTGEKTIDYTLTSKFLYENANLNICEFLSPKSEDGFEKGRYTVNVFNKKEMVSTTDFTLK